MHFIGVKKLRKISGFVIYSYLKDSAVVKRDARYVKDVYMKGVPFPVICQQKTSLSSN